MTAVPCRRWLIAIISIAVLAVIAGSEHAVAAGARSASQGAAVLPVPGTSDVNGDGFDDVMLWGPAGTIGDGGFSWPLRVVFGKRDNAFVDIRTPGAWGTLLDGPYGFEASTVGDVNGDGRADILTSLMKPGPRHRFRGYVVVYGPAAAGMVAGGTPGSQFRITRGEILDEGLRVVGVGDVNGDGLDDLGAIDGGSLWVIYGRRSRGDVDLDRLGGSGSRIRAPSRPARLDGGFTALNGVGDVNGDGIDDMTVGANWYPARSCVFSTEGSGLFCNGRVWLIYGRRDLPRRIVVPRAGGSGITVVANPDPAAPNLRYGNLAVASAAGDLDGDGYADILITPHRGIGLVVWGSKRLDTVKRVNLTPRTSRLRGLFVPIGDFDGDSRADLVGLADDPTLEAGSRAFLIRGRRWAGLRPLIPRRPRDGHLLLRESHLDPVAVGDVNGDGRADLGNVGLLSVPSAADGWVLFGGSDRRPAPVTALGARGFHFGRP